MTAYEFTTPTLNMVIRNDNSNHRRRKHHVRFASNVVKHEADEDQAAEIVKEDVWYSAQDLLHMKKEIFVAVHFKDTDKAIPNYNWRGLEHYAKGSPEEHLEQRQDFVSEFLALQHDLSQREILDQEDPLGLFAANKSKAHRKEATKRAKQDEIDAKKIYKSSKMLKWRRTSNEKELLSSKSVTAFMKTMVKGFRPSSFSKHAQTA